METLNKTVVVWFSPHIPVFPAPFRGVSDGKGKGDTDPSAIWMHYKTLQDSGVESYHLAFLALKSYFFRTGKQSYSTLFASSLFHFPAALLYCIILDCAIPHYTMLQCTWLYFTRTCTFLLRCHISFWLLLVFCHPIKGWDDQNLNFIEMLLCI